MKLFAVAVLACRQDGRDLDIKQAVCMVEAADQDAAIGKGHRIVRKCFPPDAAGDWHYFVTACPADAAPVTVEGATLRPST